MYSKSNSPPARRSPKKLNSEGSGLQEKVASEEYLIMMNSAEKLLSSFNSSDGQQKTKHDRKMSYNPQPKLQLERISSRGSDIRFKLTSRQGSD